MKVKDLKIYEGMLIIVDMINGFVKEGDIADPKIGDIIPKQIELIKQNQAKKNLIVFIKDTHEKDSTEHKRFDGKFHCIKGTKEELVIDELKEFENDEDTIGIEKNSTSFMEAPKFRELMKNAINIRKIEVVGCCTDICVANGTIGLANYLDQENRDIEIIVHEDAIATHAEDKRQNYVEAAKLLMKQQGIQLVKKIK